MISVEAAFDLVMGTAPDFGSRTVPLDQSAGRILRQQVLTDRDFPPFNRVCMDGIAIDSGLYARGRRKFYRQEVLAAGEAPPSLVGPDACVEVMTGAVLPPGTDAVVPYEQLEQLREHDGTWFVVKAQVSPGQHVHRKGADASGGTVLLEKGSLITPPAVALLASAGVHQVRVGRVPEVAVICSGDELVPVSEVPLPHQIRQSNGYALQALLHGHGITSRLYHVRDDREEIAGLLRQLREGGVDCIISTGGVSAGKKDHIPLVLRMEGGEVLFHKVAQRPGKPLLAGKWKQGPVFFGLPGNPVSCMVSCCRYIIPWMLEGLKSAPAPAIYARLREAITFSPRLTFFVPVSLGCGSGGELTAYPLKGKGSGDMIGMRGAAAFAELPAEEDHYPAGTACRIWPLKQGWL